jgi:hypothetical protein
MGGAKPPQLRLRRINLQSSIFNYNSRRQDEDEFPPAENEERSAELEVKQMRGGQLHHKGKKDRRGRGKNLREILS